MRSTLLLSILPFLVVAAPEPEPAPVAQFIPGSIQRACECDPKNFPFPSCNGLSDCDCSNKSNIACWNTKPLTKKCGVQLQSCPGPSSAFASENPACGRGLPTCAAGKICRKVDYNCNDQNPISNGCLGLCVPVPPMEPKQVGSSPTRTQPKGTRPKGTRPKAVPSSPTQQPWTFGTVGPQPKAGNPSNPFRPKQPKQPNRQPKPANQQPPVGGYVPTPGGAAPGNPGLPLPVTGICATPCQPNQVCVIDPHDEFLLVRGPKFMCVSNQGICGGWKNSQCPAKEICVRDPRLQCSGEGCTGLCA